MVESERIKNNALNKEFHEKAGGRKRYDLRFYGEPRAVETRELITRICQERHYADSLTDLAGEIGVSGGTLSLAIGGRAGKKPNKEMDGLSSTEFIVSKLKKIVEEK